jgi:hypothetical protein
LDLNVFEEDDVDLWAKLIAFVRRHDFANSSRFNAPETLGPFGETSAQTHRGLD